MPSNLLAHHLDVLEAAGLIERSRSSGDGRRRYVHLIHARLEHLGPRAEPSHGAGAVRVHRELGPLPARRRSVDRDHRRAGGQRRHPPGRAGPPRRASPPPGAPASTSATRADVARRAPSSPTADDHGVRPRPRGARPAAWTGSTGRSPTRSRSARRRRSTRPSPSSANASPPSRVRHDRARRAARDRHRRDPGRAVAAPGRRGARHRPADRRRHRLRDHGQPALAERRRPAAARERRRHRRRADRADPDLRVDLRRPLQPGRHPRRPGLRHDQQPRHRPLHRRPDHRWLPRRRSSPT